MTFFCRQTVPREAPPLPSLAGLLLAVFAVDQFRMPAFELIRGYVVVFEILLHCPRVPELILGLSNRILGPERLTLNIRTTY